MRSGCREALVGALIFVGVYVTHLVSPNATPFDSRWTVHTAASLVREGNATLDEYLPELEQDGFYAIECVTEGKQRSYPIKSSERCPEGHYYHFYPIAVPLLAAPAVGGMELVLEIGKPWFRALAESAATEIRRQLLRGDLTGSSMLVELILACVVVAAAAAVLYWAARELLGWAGALLISLLFAYGTSAWSTGSRALWMHGFSMLLLSLVLFIAARAERRPGWIPWMGALLALAFYARPTNAVGLAVFSAWVWWRHRGQFWRYVAAMAPVVIAFTAIHWSIYGSVLAPYSYVKRSGTMGLGLHPEVGTALAGNLVSPSRGLFVYSPVLLFSLLGLWVWLKGGRMRPLAATLGCLLAGHWLLISTYGDWYGGHSYGPRYFSDLSPVWVFLLIPLLARWRVHLRPARMAVLAVLAAVSVWIHAQGATCWPCMDWNMRPVELRLAPERLWDWRDPPFLRGVREG